MELSRAGNQYLGDTEPWKLVKTDPIKVQTIMNIALQITASVSILMEPFLPFSAKKLQSDLKLTSIDWSDAGNVNLLETEHQIITEKPDLLFPKFDDSQIDAQINRLQKIKQENEAELKRVEALKTPAEPKEIVEKETIQFDDFMKMDIKVGTIIEAEAVKKSKKLLQLKVDMGHEQRTIMSGIAESFSPEEVIGQQVCVLANLAPRKMMGVMSQGMILMADDGYGKLAFVTPSRAVLNGQGVS